MTTQTSISSETLTAFRVELADKYRLERELGRGGMATVYLAHDLANDRHVVTIRHSPDGRTWSKFGVQMEVSGYHHNTAYDFLSLRPAIYAAGAGEVRFRNAKYRALP